MPRFKIKDEDNREYIVEEVEDEEIEIETKENDNALSDEEIAALKMLAKSASELLKLLKTEEEEHEAVEDEEIDEDKDEYIEEEKDEEVVDTMKGHDSKSSYGSLEKETRVTDTQIDTDLEIAEAWAKRYGGK